MKTINKEFFESMKEFREKVGLQDELTDNDCKCYANMLSVMNDITEGQFTFNELLSTYDFVTDVIDGSRPDIMIMNDKYRDTYRLLKRYSTTKNLDDDTRKKLAFLIFQAKCIMIMDEETGEPTWNMGMFEKGTKEFLNEYEYELKEYKDRYEIKQPLSDPSKSNFGLDPENPIEVLSVSAEYDYLGLLLTEDGKKITYKRRGSTMHSDGETHIDIYDIYVKKMFGEKQIATIYISGYGNENTLDAPKGFRMMTLEEVKKMMEK